MNMNVMKTNGKNGKTKTVFVVGTSLANKVSIPQYDPSVERRARDQERRQTQQREQTREQTRDQTREYVCQATREQEREESKARREEEQRQRQAAREALFQIQQLRFEEFKLLNADKTCRGFCSFGERCTRKECTYAHDWTSFKPYLCSFEGECKKPECKFYHPEQSMESYFAARGVVFPLNIPQVSKRFEVQPKPARKFNPDAKAFVSRTQQARESTQQARESNNAFSALGEIEA